MLHIYAAYAIITSPMGAVAKYCDEYVCLSVCLSARKSPEPLMRSLSIFSCMMPMSVVRSSSSTLMIGCIAYRREGVLFPIDNALYSIAFGTHTKTTEPIDMLFGMMSGLGPTKCIMWG